MTHATANGHSGKMNALVQVGPDGEVRYEQIEIPQLRKGEALVKVMAAGLCGSDPFRNMRKYPGIPGHEFTGVVAEINGDSAEFGIGSRVIGVPLMPCKICDMCEEGRYSTCRNYDFVGSRRWGAFAQYVAVPLTNLLTLPENLSFVEGALVEPASVALRAARHGQIGVGSSVTILGAGAIGLLVGLWAQAMGATLISVADINPARLEHARALGFDDVFDSRSGEYVEHIDALTQGKGVDIVFESAGSPITQRQAIEAVRPGGRAVFLGITHADLQLPEQVAESILRKEVCVQGSWAAYGNPFPGPDWMDTIEFMSTGRVDFSKIADWTGPLAEGPDIYQQFRDKTIHSTKIIFLPNEDSEGLPDVQQ